MPNGIIAYAIYKIKYTVKLSFSIDYVFCVQWCRVSGRIATTGTHGAVGRAIQRDAAIADALASNSKLNAKHDVSDSPMYQSLLLDREQWKRIAKNRQDQIKKNELRYDELLTMYKDLEQQLKGSQAMQADPENQQTAYKELQTEHERLKTEYETVKTLCERTLEAYNAIQNDYKALQVELQQIRTQSHTEPHNARNAGRKPKFTNEQMEQVRKMAADGLSVRKIAAEMSCSIGLVCKILHSNKN